MGKYTVLVNENMGEVNWEMVKKADVHGVMSVSYTHLDVYKRQAVFYH